jgi:YidC/Oxa1 family membrane protein insertase
MPNLANTLVDAFGRNQLFAVEQDMSATTSWLRADLMISDWSGAAVEYAFSLGRPVLYVDTPQKLMNARSGELGLPAFEERIRSQIGRIISPDDVADAPALVHGLLGAGGRAFDIAGPSAAAVFNVGRSVDAAADALLALDREIG